MKLPFSNARDREFRDTYVNIASRLHLAEFEMSGLMSDVLAMFERADKPTARSRFTAYIGAAFPRLDQPKLALNGAQRKRFYLMALEHRRFVNTYGKQAPQVWNDMGGWLSVTILNGLPAVERRRAESFIMAEVGERGVGVTVSTVRDLIAANGIRPRKPGRPRHADRDVAVALLRTEMIEVVRRLQTAARRSPAKRTDVDNALLDAEPVKIVEGVFRKAHRKGAA
jgi:hypothetical protein